MDGTVENRIGYLSEDCLLSIFNKLECESDRNSFGLTCKDWLKIHNIGRRSLTLHCSFNPKVDQKNAKCIPRILARSPYVERISLSCLGKIPDILALSGSSLRSLSLYCCLGITDADLAQVAIRCPNLVIVELQSCSKITDYGLESLSMGCHALKSLNLASCKYITDDGISSVFANSSNICTLIISNCRRVYGYGFKGCPSTLSYLEAESCLLCRDGLLDVASCDGLGYLNVQKLGSYFGQQGLDGLRFAKNLRFLNLKMCEFLTDGIVTAIASGCPLIEEWNLAVCDKVCLPGWSSIGLYCKNLRVLHVNRCRRFCDEGLLALGDGCARLEVLHMSGCFKITGGGMGLFCITRPNVKLRKNEARSIGPSVENLFRLECLQV